jgi:hypothetical protein
MSTNLNERAERERTKSTNQMVFTDADCSGCCRPALVAESLNNQSDIFLYSHAVEPPIHRTTLEGHFDVAA